MDAVYIPPGWAYVENLRTGKWDAGALCIHMHAHTVHVIYSTHSVSDNSIAMHGMAYLFRISEKALDWVLYVTIDYTPG